jgi:hypothetical protein
MDGSGKTSCAEVAAIGTIAQMPCGRCFGSTHRLNAQQQAEGAQCMSEGT